MYFIGVDLGTNGIKAGIIDEAGRIIGSSYWETKLISRKPGLMEQDPQDFVAGTIGIIKEILEKTEINPVLVTAISIDGQMGGIIGIDAYYGSITGYDMGLDVRSEKYNAYLHDNYKKFLRTKTCGSPRNLPKILWWKKEYPSVYKKVKKFVTLNSFVAGNLAGLKSDDAFIDYTLLSFFGLEDIKKLEWSKEFCKILDIDSGKLPMVVEPWKIIGRFTKAAAEGSGLNEGTLIIAGAGDQPAGLLGAGLVKPGTLFEVSGSSTLQFIAVDRIVPDNKNGSVMYIPSVIADTFYAFNYINGGGICLRWFRDNFLKECFEKGGIEKGNILQAIEKNLDKIPAGSEGLIFIPYFGGRQCPYDNKIRGSWIGLNWGHKLEHLYKSILESIGYDARAGIDNIKRLFPNYSFSEIAISGGGAKSDVWNQIKADITGLVYLKSESFESNIRGSGILAGFGSGVIGDMAKVASNIDIVDRSKIFKPDISNRNVYDSYFNIYRDIFKNTLNKTFNMIFEKTSQDF